MNKTTTFSGMLSKLPIAIVALGILFIGFSNGFPAAFGQQTQKKITGKVFDDESIPLPGAIVIIDGTTRGVSTDADGSFTIEVATGDVLKTSFIGYDEKTTKVDDRLDYTIIMKPKTNLMDEVTVVAFAKQKKESVLASVTTVNPAELKTPTSNMTTALGGRIAGVISHQMSGEPGFDNAEFFIRGVTTFNDHARGPLILIDNVELTSYDLARLQPDDIASFSVMKDATATALYGARGANGVILVTTKEGAEGKAKLNLRFESSLSAPTRNVKIADPVTYMRLHNEAALTRNPLNPRPYTDRKIEATERGEDPYIYPAINWRDELFKSYTNNNRLNLNVSGGGKVARYYVAGSVNSDNGILKVDNKNSFNNNIKLTTIQLRSNININVTKSTEMNVRFSGTFDDYNGPLDGGSNLYRKALAANPVLFPKYYQPNEELEHTNHILFGNSGSGNYLNPYADMVKGYKEYSKTTLIAQLELKENFSYITEGLGARIMGSTTRQSYFDLLRYYNPFYYSLSYHDPSTGKYGLTNLNPKEGTESLLFDPNINGKQISTAFYLEGAIDYNRTFNDKHAVSGLLVFTMNEILNANENTLLKSLASRNMGLAGRFTYGYDSRYFVELNFGYNGSERFAKNERFGFFPSAGVGWILSNESFWGPKLKKVVNLLKLKATYGLVGNDAIGDANDRFFYMSNVNLYGPSPLSFGQNFSEAPQTIEILRYANDRITWEKSHKMNLGLELGLFDKLTIQADYFRENRTNILMNRQSIPSTMGLHADLRSNVGEAFSHGCEIALDYNQFFNKDLWVTGTFNFTYATSEYKVFEEPDYGYPWLSWVGLPIGQPTGFIGERLFIDEADIANSPKQSFGDVMPGDIKYKDINGDDIINTLDMVPIGYPETPNAIFGFGASVGFKGLDFSFFFQAATQASFFIDPIRTAPFINSDPDKLYGGREVNNAMLGAWANNYWSESNRDSYALWPRLSDEVVDNNVQRSTWWMRDGSYLRLKSLEIGYTLPQRWTKKIGMESLRIYLSGLNLYTWSKFKLWDTEMGSNGLGYPIQRVFNIGINLNF